MMVGMQCGDPVLSIIIPAHDGLNYLVACLKSINEQPSTISPEVIVVDNGSRIMLEPAIQKVAPSTLVVRTNKNLGYGAACNLGAKKANGKILLFLNSDTVVMKGSLEKILQAFDSNKDLGCVSCNELLEDGTPVLGYRSYHTLRSAIAHTTGYRIFQNELDRFNKSIRWNRNEDRWIECPGGCAWAIPSVVFKEIGKFDENLFLYFEEQDVATRIERLGCKIRHVADAKIIHYGSRSSGWLGIVRKRLIWIRSFLYVLKKHDQSCHLFRDGLLLYGCLPIWCIRGFLSPFYQAIKKRRPKGPGLTGNF